MMAPKGVDIACGSEESNGRATLIKLHSRRSRVNRQSILVNHVLVGHEILDPSSSEEGSSGLTLNKIEVSGDWGE